MQTAAQPLAGQQIVNNANPFSQLQSMMNLAKSFNNPDAFLDSMATINPKAADVKNLIKQHNGDARAAFYEKAKAMGADPNAILSMIPR